MICSPADWVTSSGSDYKIATVLHQPMRSDVGVWNQNGGIEPGTPNNGRQMYTANCRDDILYFARLYNWARVKSVSLRIEWLGCQVRKAQRGLTNLQVGNIDFYELEFDTAGTSLYCKRLHEQADRGIADNVNADQLAVANQLGLNNRPRLVYPDMDNTMANPGTMRVGNLLGTAGVKLLRFSRQKRVKILRWKPITKFDYAYSKWDLIRTANGTGIGGAYDDDARCGGWWFAQDSMLNTGAVTGWDTGVGTSSATRIDFFRVAVNYHWTLSSRTSRIANTNL